MKNILYLHAGAEMYGADKVLLDLVSNMDKNKYKPLVILPGEGVLVDKFKEKGIDTRVIEYPILRRKYFNIKGIFSYVYNFFKYSKRLVKIVKENNIDIIHVNTAAVLEGCYVKRKTNKKLIWSIHEIIPKPKVVAKFISHCIAKYSDITTTDSEAVKRHMKSLVKFKKEVKVVYNGVDSNIYSPENTCEYLYDELSIPKDAKVIGMLGRVNAWKGQSDLVKAANIIMSKDNKVYTVLVGSAFAGDEWRVDKLKEEVEQSPYKDRFIIQPYRKDSTAFYKLFDVFVLPSTSPDPLPTVVLEAMGTGKPIVGYRHGGVCEMVKEGYNGLLANVCDFKDLSSKIETLIDEDDKRTSMGIASRERQKSMFSLESYVSNFEGIYNLF